MSVSGGSVHHGMVVRRCGRDRTRTSKTTTTRTDDDRSGVPGSLYVGGWEGSSCCRTHGYGSTYSTPIPVGDLRGMSGGWMTHDGTLILVSGEWLRTGVHYPDAAVALIRPATLQD